MVEEVAMIVRLFRFTVGCVCAIWGANAFNVDPYGALFFYFAVINALGVCAGNGGNDDEA